MNLLLGGTLFGGFSMKKEKKETNHLICIFPLPAFQAQPAER